MAIWQFSLLLIPRPKLVEFLGEVPACVDPHVWEAADLEHWDNHVLPEEVTTILAEELPRMEHHWCESVSAWGSYDGNLVEVSFERARIEWFHARIDLRAVSARFILAICQIASMSDCWLLTEDLRLIEPELQPMIREMKQSSAFRFVSDPKGFLDSFRGMPRFD